MQRRAAAVYFVLFVLLGAGAYTFMQVGMSSPTVSFDADTYAEDDQLSAGGVTYTVSGIEAQAEEGEDGAGGGLTRTGELTYMNETAGEEETVELEQGENVTLGGVQHFSHFPDNDSVYILPSDQFYGAYQEQIDTQEHFHERQAGFWGVVYVSFIAAIVLLMSAYLPVKG